MPIERRKIDYQLELSDAVLEQYPNSAVVSIKFEQLSDAPNSPSADRANKYIRWNTTGTSLLEDDGTGGGTTLNFSVVNSFPGSPTDGQVVLLDRQVLNNPPSIYKYSSATSSWTNIIEGSANADFTWPVVSAFPSSPATNDIVFLRAAVGNDSIGVYYYDGTTWQQIGAVYDDTQVRAMITALAARVTTLEGQDPLTGLSTSGNTLTYTQADGTSTDITIAGATPYNDGPIRALIAALDTRVTAEEAENNIRTITLDNRVLVITHDDNTTTRLTLPSAGDIAIDTTDVLYGVAGVETSNATDQATAVSQAQTDFGTEANRATKNVDVNLQGGLLSFMSGTDAGFYRVWIAILMSEVNNKTVRFYDDSNLDETALWAVGANQTVGGNTYRLYARLQNLEENQTKAFRIQTFR